MVDGCMGRPPGGGINGGVVVKWLGLRGNKPNTKHQQERPGRRSPGGSGRRCRFNRLYDTFVRLYEKPGNIAHCILQWCCKLQ